MINRVYSRSAVGICLCLWLALIPASAIANDYTRAEVVRVYDGDTILVEILGNPPSSPLNQRWDKRGGIIEKVRFIGIDCPEVWENEKFGRDMERDKRHTPAEVLALGAKAKRFTADACPPGAAVRLEQDVERRDRYGRLLAYVWTRQSSGKETMLNAELVSAGLARTMTIPPNVKYSDMLRKLQQKARRNRSGMWSK